MTLSSELDKIAKLAGFNDTTLPTRSDPRYAKLRKLFSQLAKIKGEGLALYMPLLIGQEFHKSTAKYRITDGTVRSGKTECASAETSYCFMGCDPYDKFVKKNGMALITGRDGDHLALMWRKLTEQGTFKKIRDEHTNLWRTVRWDVNNPTQLDPYDEAYREKWQDAPPLIPERCIVKKAMEDSGKGIPRLVTFSTGWKSIWRSSNGNPPRGDHYHYAWFDELLNNARFYAETMRGLVALDEPPKHTPKFVWSAALQDCDIQLEDLRRRADDGDPDVGAFQFLIKDNPYIPESEKVTFYNSLSREDRETMYYGHSARQGKKAYIDYDPMGDQTCDPFPIPDDWARYVVLDPGRQNCASLLFAVPPDESHTYVYDGFLLRHSDANHWADEVAERQGESRFEAFVIDKRAGKQHGMGNHLRVCDLYWNALAERNIAPAKQGTKLAGFFEGFDDVAAREETLVGWMGLRAVGPFRGTCRLQVFRGRIPQLDEQIRNAYHVKPGKRADLEEDLLVCLEYGAAFDPGYYPPTPLVDSPEDIEHTALMNKLKSLKKGHRLRGVSIV